MSAREIGALRRRLVLEALLRTDDEGGGAIETWSEIARVWGEITSVSGNETYEADRIAGRISHRVAIRYRNDVLPEMRLLYGLRRFDIRAVIDGDGRQRRLLCLCEERDL